MLEIPTIGAGGGITVIVLVMEQPAALYVIVLTPVPAALATPALDMTMADGLDEVHVPEGTISLSVADSPAQIVDGPDIGLGNGLTVSAVVAVVLPQELVAVNEKTPELAAVAVNVLSSEPDEYPPGPLQE